MCAFVLLWLNVKAYQQELNVLCSFMSFLRCKLHCLRKIYMAQLFNICYHFQALIPFYSWTLCSCVYHFIHVPCAQLSETSEPENSYAYVIFCIAVVLSLYQLVRRSAPSALQSVSWWASHWKEDYANGLLGWWKELRMMTSEIFPYHVLLKFCWELCLVVHHPQFGTLFVVR